MESQKSARSATVRAIIHRIKSSEHSRSVLEPGIVKLGEGGYNDVFLISSVRSLLVEK
jgi:hypothetical protein